jgi:hypothetical protein
MPDFGPRRHGSSRNQLIDIMAVCDHVQLGKIEPAGDYDRLTISAGTPRMKAMPDTNDYTVVFARPQ